MNYIQAIKKYIPIIDQEKKDKEMILNYIDKFDNILTRQNEIVHMTSSSLIFNKNRTKLLMIYHNIYNSRCWTGWHADWDDDMLYVAIKEAKEETWIKNIYPIFDEVFWIDILAINWHLKNSKFVSSHLHINTSFILEADENQKIEIKEEENSDVKWIPIDKLNDFCTESHMKIVYLKLLTKMKNLF